MEAIYESKTLTSAFDTDIFQSGRNFIIPLFFLLDVIVLYWRLIRRYRQMQLRHIISELHYIAEEIMIIVFHLNCVVTSIGLFQILTAW